MSWKRVIQIVVAFGLFALLIDMFNPNIAGAQNPTPVVSHQTTIGPMPSPVTPRVPNSTDEGFEIGFFIVVTLLLVGGAGFALLDWWRLPSGRGRRDPKLPSNFK